MKHAVHPEADNEFAEAVRHYNEINPNLGKRFFQEIESLVSEICKRPGRYYQFSPPARRALAREFPYLVVFVEQADRVLVLAIMHSKRRPGYWRSRLT